MAETSNLQNLVQRTLVLCKPDAIQRGIVGEIIQRFERVGLKIVGIKMVAPDAELYEKHYEEIGKLITRRGEQTFRYNLNYMLTGPVIAICLEGIEAVELVRKIVGPIRSFVFWPKRETACGNPLESRLSVTRSEDPEVPFTRGLRVSLN